MVPKPDTKLSDSVDLNWPTKPTTKPNKLELQYNGFLYDVTSFVDKHPGGNIIKMYLSTKEDAYNAVQQFHFRSIDRVSKIMRSLPKRPIDSTDDKAVRKVSPDDLTKYKKLDEDFQALFNECQAEGLFTPNWSHVFMRIMELIILVLLGLSIHFFSNSVCFKTLGVFLTALAAGRSGWVQHEGGHNSLTGNPRIDKFIEKMTMGFFLGLSASWWTSQHNRHHAMPNNIKHDVDMKTLPLIAFNKKIVRKSTQLNFFVYNQKYLFATIDMVLITAFFTIQSIIRAIKKLEIVEIIFLVLHFCIIWKMGFWYGLLTYHLSSGYFLLNFALSHTHLPVTTEPVHWVEYSLTHTANVRSGKFAWVDYWMGYLNYQIEHHLFPTMPQYKNKLIRDRVKVLAKKHNLPYHLVDYTTAVRKMFDNLGHVSNELKKHKAQ